MKSICKSRISSILRCGKHHVCFLYKKIQPIRIIICNFLIHRVTHKSKKMGNSIQMEKRGEKEKVIEEDPDAQIMQIIQQLENNSLSFVEFEDCLNLQESIYNSFNQQKRAFLHSNETEPGKTPIQNNSITETGQSSKVYPNPTQDCPICMEPKHPHETFVVQGCFHVFCLDCIRAHIAAKIQENLTTVRCPQLNCGTALDIQFCGPILPPEVVEKWGRLLCESEILGLTKFYCPFKDCSAPLLVDGGDDGIAVMESECPHCFRLFCAHCKVPWHSDVGCEEFQKLKVHEREREDIMLVELAKREKWQRCPNCEYFVERTDGCSFIKCR